MEPFFMSADSQIRINALLLQREELFVRVHEIERAVDGILGEPYPFARPRLPSDNRRPARKKTASGGRASAPEVLRKLDPGESAYRVTYRQGERTLVETHDSPEALRTLLAAQGARLQVLKIETLDADGAAKAVLLG